MSIYIHIYIRDTYTNKYVCGYMVTDGVGIYLIHNAQTSQMGARRKGKRAEGVLIPPPTPSPPLGIYGFP